MFVSSVMRVAATCFVLEYQLSFVQLENVEPKTNFEPITNVTQAMTCEDEPGYRFENDARKTCQFIAGRGNCDKIDRQRGNKPISTFCPRSCGICPNNPTMKPTANKKPSISLKPAPEPSVSPCEDEPGYRFENKEKKTCQFIAQNNKCNKIDKQRGNQKISTFCPRSCGMCPKPSLSPISSKNPTMKPTTISLKPSTTCEDDQFFVKNRGGRKRTCSYIGNGTKLWRINKWCNKKKEGILISHFCCKTCTLCTKCKTQF